MDKMKMQSKDRTQENYEKLAALFPNAVTETITGYDEDGNAIIERAIDKDVLQQEISAVVVDGRDERYQFTWPDKKKSILAANAPIRKTLRPCREESVDFDNTENLYIEGDNLDVLKLLQETYLGKVKMIYIDPPYNTGHDFVYNDDFKESADEYMENSGQLDEEGNRLFQNTESNGRFHTDWLNMLYPRLKIARDLLLDDGVIFISIDDNEQDNLKKVCDEVFGDSNFIATMIWQQGKKSSGNLIGINHEYMVVYAKNRAILDTPANSFKQKKEGLERIYLKFEELKKKHGNDYNSISMGMKKFYSSLSESDPAYAHRMYCLVDKNGLFQSDNSSAPDKPDTRSHRPLIHPITHKPTAVPAMGWRFTDKTLDELVSKGYILFGEDETKVPRVKRYLHEYEFEMPSTVFYKPGASASSELQRIFGGKVYNNPKDRNEIKRIVSFVSKKEDIIVDFFSGSATTAHAVMQLNAEDGGNRKFIMVQLPEPCDEKSEAYKAGYKNICEIGKERIRRAGAQIMQNAQCIMHNDTGSKDQQNLDGDSNSELCSKNSELDIGFRVLKLDSTNMKDVYYNPHDVQMSILDNLESNIKEDRTPEDLLFQVMLDLGILLSSKIAIHNVECTMHNDNNSELCIKNYEFFDVADGFLIACFDNDVTEEVITEIAKKQPAYFVMRDSSMKNDSVATNFDQIFATYSPDTVRKVI